MRGCEMGCDGVWAGSKRGKGWGIAIWAFFLTLRGQCLGQFDLNGLVSFWLQ